MGAIEKGKVRDPMSPKVYGVGYFDVDEDESEVYHELFYYTQEYIMIGGMAYKIEDIQYGDAEKCDATINADGSITYDTYFYNGGCGFEECLNEAVDKAKMKGDKI